MFDGGVLKVNAAKAALEMKFVSHLLRRRRVSHVFEFV